MYIKKLRSNYGGSMTLVILAMALVTIAIFSFTIQVGNQLKSTTKNQESLQVKYNAESIIEDIISEFIESIDINKVDESYKINYKTWTNNEIPNVKIDTTKEEKDNSIKFILDIKEIKEDLDSLIYVNISNISGEKYKETCNINYEIISWRNK